MVAFLVFHTRENFHELKNKIIVGIMLGFIGIIIMLTAVKISSGAIFDVRSILISTIGLFFGLIPTIIVGVMMIISRLVIGGVGVLPGVLVIITTAAIGLLWRKYRVKKILSQGKKYFLEFYLFGIVVHLGMLLCMFVFPRDQAYETLSQIILPVLLIYPVVSYIICILVKNQIVNNRNQTLIKDYEARYRSITNASMDGYFVVGKDGGILECNEALTKITGYSRDRLLKMKIQDIVPPEMIEETEKNMRQIVKQINTRFKSKNVRADGVVIDVQINLAYADQEEVFLGFVTDTTAQEASRQALEESERKYSSYVENAPVGIFVVDDKWRYVEVNSEVSVITGYSKEELLQMSIVDLMPEGSYQEAYNSFNKVLTKGIDISIPVQFRKKDATLGWGSVNAVKLSEHYMLGITKDITKITNTEKKLKQSEKRLLTAQSIAHVGDWEIDLKTNKIWASEESYNIYGIEKTTEYFLDEVMSRVDAEYRQLLDEALSDLITRNAEYNVEFKIRKKNTGAECFIHSIAFAERDEAGNAVKVIGTIQDITEQKKREESLEYLSYHDHLTKLYNRRFYEEMLTRLDTPSKLPLSIVICDVNGLKLINDSFGHLVGDELLKKTALVINSCCRTEDLLARHGGDEFVLLLPNTDSVEAGKIIQRIREAIEKEKVKDITISVAMGYETKTREEENIQVIFKNAEDYLYRSKLNESRSARSKTIDIIMNTLYEKNNREMMHSKRVSKLCEIIASRLNMNEYDVNKIRLAGLMHDIGKIGIDENILNKTGALTQVEWEELKKHSEIGYRILSSVNEFSEIAEFVLEHQEKWDGTGYPKGIKGIEISKEARIIAIADAYDAMTGMRTYRKSLTKEEAIKEIEKCSGTQFDPEIAKIFIEEIL